MNKTINPDKKRILIIDDNIQIHQDFKKILLISNEKESDLYKLEEALLGKTSNQQVNTFSIDCASQGKEGLKMVEESLRKKEPYAVAFVDVRMPPDWDGIETISRIWKIYPDLQIVICTAYSDYSWDELYNKFGDTDKLLILKKPFDNMEVRQLTYTLSKKWELNIIANLKMNELEKNVKERTNELHHSEKKYRTMIENSNDMIWTLDTEGKFLYFNKRAEELTGYKIKDGIGKIFNPIILEEDLEKIQNVFHDTLAGNSNHYEVKIHDIEKKILILSVNTTPIIKEGKVIGTVSFGRDITEYKKTEAELKIHREHLKLINKILRHDITNNLSVIKSAFRLYRYKKEDKYLEELEKSIKKSLDLIKNMSTLETYLDSHRNLKLRSLNDIFDKIIADYPNVDFHIQGKCRVMADETLESVFENIILNGIIHGNADKFNINIEKNEKFCKVSIANNGTIIPEIIKDNIFEESFKYGEKGQSGLGLFIVKKAMENFGGDVSVEDNKSNGSVFILNFRRIE